MQKRLNKQMKTYTLFFIHGEAKLIYGKSFEDACEKEYGEPLCPMDAMWLGGDCRNKYIFEKGVWKKIQAA